MTTTKWKVVRHYDGTCWMIMRNGELFTTRPTRKEARECVRQERALDTLAHSKAA